MGDGENMDFSNGRCWVEINLKTIIDNYLIYKKQLKSNQEIMAVVKADAYGHGDQKVATALEQVGCKHFAVSNIHEASQLCEAHVDGEILILGYTPPSSFNELYVKGITQAVLSEEYADLLAQNGNHIKCQFAIDTGMNRIGLDANDPKKCAEVIREYSKKLEITGIFTHLCVADSTADEDVIFTDQQIKSFIGVSNCIRDLHLAEEHCLNTAGGLWHNKYGNIVRLGISLYGLKPDFYNTLPYGIKPALEWKSVISMVKSVHNGEDIGYGRSYHVEHEMRIATIPTGYADGYNRQLSNKGFVLIHGKKAPIVGRVCMDQLMVDVSSIEEAKMGDIVTLIGQSGSEHITADEMGYMIGTIGYEILCSISKRVDRVYI